MSTFSVNSSMVKMMKAVRIETTGGPEVLQIVDVPRPIAGPGEVLVRNSAIGVGMPDMLVRRGCMPGCLSYQLSLVLRVLA